MSSAWFVWLCLVYSLAITDNLQIMGNSCGGSGLFIPSFFGLSPFPPIEGENIDIMLQGTFVNNTYVQESVVGVCQNYMIWNYFPNFVDFEFPAQTPAVFEQMIPGPTAQGSYTITMQINSGEHIFCWEVSFIVN